MGSAPEAAQVRAFDPDGKPIANTWQGIFPVLNTKDDGYDGTAPDRQWTTDWYRPSHSREAAVNPTGPDLISIRAAPGQLATRVIKGGRSAGDIFCDVGGQLPQSEVTAMTGHLDRMPALASQKHTE